MFDWDYKKEPLSTVATDATLQFCHSKSGKTFGEVYNYGAVSELLKRMKEFAATIKSGDRVSYELEHTYLDVLKKVFDINFEHKRDKHLSLEKDVPAGIELIVEQIENAKNSKDKGQIKQAMETCSLIATAARGYCRYGRYGLVA